MQSSSFGSIPLQTIPNPQGGGVNTVRLQSSKELPQPDAPQSSLGPAEAKTELRVNSQVQELARSIPLPFPNQTVWARRYEINEDFLKLFRKVEINIQLLDAIRQVPRYTKFLKELYVHKRKKKGVIKIGGVVSVLVKHENTSVQQILPKKCQDPGIFTVPCTISSCTFTNAMLDLRESINVMLVSIYKSLNLGDLKPTRMVIQLVNRSVVRTLGILKDIVVQVNELIFPTDFYVLDMKDKPSEEGSALILGRPFLMMVRRKIDIHVGTLSMEFGDTFVNFNIFEALKHPVEDHSIFSIDTIDGLVKGYFQIGIGNVSLVNFVDIFDTDSNMQEPTKIDFDNLEEVETISNGQPETGSDLNKRSPNKHLSPPSDKVDQPTPSTQEQHVSPQWRLNSTLLDVIKKEVTKLHAAGIIYPILDSQWVSLVQVVPKKSEMTVIKSRQDEMVPAKIQNNWRVCINYRKLNQATCKDHFPLLFVDQVLEKLAGYMQIHIEPMDQHKTTFTCPFRMFAYTRMSFGLYNAPSTFQRCMISIFLDLLEDCMDIFMDDFTVYVKSFEACLDNLSRVYRSNLVLNFEKCHFMVTKGIVLGHLVSTRGIENDKAKIDVISSLPNPASVREVFTGNSLKISGADFVFDQPCVDAFQELNRRLTSAPILQAPNWELSFELMCDTSNSTLGAVLGQQVGK
ncbi:Retrovirus-related Pol polyprotein, partial [Mucuna pruriens]